MTFESLDVVVVPFPFKVTDQMVEFSPIKILGRWKAGFALDWPTRYSEFIGHNEYG